MEFERALFRIHQRTLLSDGVRKVRLQLERWLPWVIFVTALCLVFLHSNYVGKARCLPAAMRRVGLWNASAFGPALENDVLLFLTVVEQSLDGGDDEMDISLQMSSPVDEDSRVTSSPATGTVVSGSGVGIEAETAVAMKQAAEEALSLPPLSSAPSPERVIVTYRFALDRELVFMRPSLLEKHKFKVQNVTISDRCLAQPRLLREALRLFDAFDGIVINELAYTLRSRGYLERVDGDAKVESWTWSQEQVENASPKNGRSIFAALHRKVFILTKSIITFFLISAITGFFIRVAVNGSAVLMFPLALLSQNFGSGRMSMGVLIRSFPWIGVHVEVLRRVGRPLTAYFRSQFIFLFIQSFAYLSCNLAWRFILYRQSTPDGFEERIFSWCSVIELFSLIFVRSTSSTLVFPKLSTGCMVYLHFYVFCSLYPFHLLAYSVCTTTCGYIMIYCLNHFEEHALRADPFAYTTPTAAHPRSSYMPQLSPSWTTEAAPLWTMFYPPEHPDVYPEEAMRAISNEEYMMP
mmetsp:Transcript_97013/g.182432  ORF Transcript_97013/g.182432 Transcript_97013/m.182432 type:complete len:522 (+) Transcript_97013:148-1713(+)